MPDTITGRNFAVRKLNYITISLIFMLLAASLLSGCNTDTNSDIYWFRDPVGFFHTNDLERAQEEIPFTIILPSYLPEDMGLSTLKIYGPIEINIGDYYQGIEVQISYISGEREIYIYEDNPGQIMHPNPDLEPSYFKINGITVLRQATGIKEGLSYNWNHEKISYAVRVYRIDDDEAFRIVESMIKQLE
jgi:hypothetical protein